MKILDDNARYKLLKLLEKEPNISQRELAKELGISLGKVNYCLQAIIEKGWVKAGNFARNKNKKKYSYLLTPSGIEEKAKVTIRFLKCKQEEFENIQNEIEDLRREVLQLEQSNVAEWF